MLWPCELREFPRLAPGSLLVLSENRTVLSFAGSRGAPSVRVFADEKPRFEHDSMFLLFANFAFDEWDALEEARGSIYRCSDDKTGLQKELSEEERAAQWDWERIWASAMSVIKSAGSEAAP